MRFVPIKSEEQLDMQSLHWVRERWIKRRTSVVNQIRSLLLERGVTVRTGRKHLVAALPGILEDPDTNLSGPLRVLLAQLQWEMNNLVGQIEEVDAVVVRTPGQNEACQRLETIPGIGPLTATASGYSGPLAPSRVLMSQTVLRGTFAGCTWITGNPVAT
jgi:transposase